MRPMQRKEDKVTIKTVEKITGIRYDIVRYRMMMLNIDKADLNGKNINRIKKYNPRKTNKVYIFGINEQEKIIKYYFSNKNNSYKQVSECLGFTEWQVNKTIDKFLLNKGCLIAESKINRK